MKLERPLLFGTLIQRYKRFLADVKLENGDIITVHCANSGSMKTCAKPGWRVMISDSQNPKRKLRFTWEMVHNGKGWIGINTQMPNKIVKEAIENNEIPELTGYTKIITEKKYGQNSRIDLFLEKLSGQCYVEVKNVTMMEENTYLFPDAVTIRGLKHLNELAEMKKQGHRAVMFFLIQRNNGTIFKPCKVIDPEYSDKLNEVYEKGVEILPYVANVSPHEITISHKVNFVL